MINKWQTPRVLELMGIHEVIEFHLLKEILSPITDSVLEQLKRLPSTNSKKLPWGIYSELCQDKNGRLIYECPDHTFPAIITREGVKRENFICWLQKNSDLLQEFRRGGAERYLTVDDFDAVPDENCLVNPLDISKMETLVAKEMAQIQGMNQSSTRDESLYHILRDGIKVQAQGVQH